MSSTRNVNYWLISKQGWWMNDAGTVEEDKVPIRETWECLEQLVDEGTVKSIGVSNF